jgi:hypothetical protein
MEIALIKKNQKEPSHQIYNINQQQQEYKKPTPKKNHTEEQEIKRITHLTVIGVCTTICPENSGM